jgi:hypothetical protein
MEIAMPSTRHLFIAAVAGALGTWFLDPQQGRRRVALVRDKARSAAHAGSGLAATGLRDLANRGRGVVAELRRVGDTSPTRDDVLAERIRARLGRWVSHPETIEVDVADGAVMLTGEVLEREQERLVHELHWMRGVRRVQNRLQPQPGASIPTSDGRLRASARRRSDRSDAWSPGGRLLATAGGAGLALAGAGRRGLKGVLLAIGGAALATRGAVNRPFARMGRFTTIVETEGSPLDGDLERIDVADEAAIRRWAATFDASPQQIRDAVRAVGERSDDVELHLTGARATVTGDRVAAQLDEH